MALAADKLARYHAEVGANGGDGAREVVRHIHGLAVRGDHERVRIVLAGELDWVAWLPADGRDRVVVGVRDVKGLAVRSHREGIRMQAHLDHAGPAARAPGGSRR